MPRAEPPPGPPGPPGPSRPPPSTNQRGIAFMFASTIGFAAMHGMIRHLSAELHPFEIAFFRNLFGLLVLMPWLVRYRLGVLRTDRLGLHGLRAAINVVAMLAFFYALSLRPLSEVTALAFTAPIFVTVLAMLVLRETVGLRRWSAVLAGFAGTVIALQPDPGAIEFGSLLVLMSSAAWACALLVIKVLARTESSVTITTYMVLLMAPLSLVPAVFVWQWPDPGQLLWLVAIGVSGTGGQLLMTQALKEAETNVVMPLDFFKLVWATGIGYLAFAEVPKAHVWIGGALIFASATYIVLRERALERARARALAEPEP